MISEFKIPGRRKKNKTELIKEMWAVEEMVVDFPDSYEETSVVLLPVDPCLAHVYWNIAPGDLKRVRSRLREKDLSAQATLRFHDITYIIFDGTNAHNSFDIDINTGNWAGNWYVHLWSPDKSYCVDLGLRTGDGRFFQIVRSNVVEMPPASLSEKREERYMLVLGDYKRVEIIPQMLTMQPQYGLSQEAKPVIEDGLPAPPPSCSFKELYKSFESENMDKTVMSQGLTEEDAPPPPLYPLPTTHCIWPSAAMGTPEGRQQLNLPPLMEGGEGEGGVTDLTEMNERGLPVGISSRVIKP